MKTMAKQTPHVNNMFLIGAGFTKSVFPNAPLNKDLLAELCKDTTSRNVLKGYHEEFKTEDIEILLTRLDLEITIPKAKRQTALQTARKAIERQLAEYFGQFRFGNHEDELRESEWLGSLAKEIFADNDAIISLNYDCLLEGVLDYYEAWSPKGGYAVLDRNPLLGSQFPQNEKNIRIFKLHGSEHFVEAPDPMNKTKTSISFPVNESIYPRSGKNRYLNYGAGQIEARSYIIAPSFVKMPHQDIELMMLKALEAAASANNFIVIGCGLRPEDSFLWLLLISFLDKPGENRKLIIVDPNAEEIRNKIVNHYFVDIGGFVNISLFSNGLEKDVHQLIDILKPKTDNT